MAKTKKIKLPPMERFDNYYTTYYKDRWTTLKEALLVKSSPIELKEELLKPYYMDEASIICAKLLDVQKDDLVLDMCAAPGGKTLILASELKGSGLLISNDRSSKRRARLHNVINDHLKPEYQVNIKVSAHDASKWGIFEKNIYDKILLDAPCSSERHVLATPSALEMWSPNRPKHLAIQQFAMLASALDAVKPGGLILYSTCAITPQEDEEVIEKLFKKRNGKFTLIDFDAQFTEKRKYGQIILPDTSKGKGPLYFCLIKKTEDNNE
ncbi:MAG: RsmB/NOP family class I SAM-dependent RNA methyltransferase [Spirochaetaceae bacterium]|nr:RsmB/NOP family class I SAM-dependent RNA methyltransferase [Spirochaetaceae bacterium]